MMTLLLNGSSLLGVSLFMADESDKSTSEIMLLQTFNHSTSTTNVAGERHPTWTNLCIKSVLLHSY